MTGEQRERPGLHCFKRGEQHAFDDGEQPVVQSQNQADEDHAWLSDAKAEQGQIADDDAEQGQTANDDAKQGQTADDEAEEGQTADVDAEQGQTADEAKSEQGQTADDEAKPEQRHIAGGLTRAERKRMIRQWFEDQVEAIGSAIAPLEGSAMASSSVQYQ